MYYNIVRSITPGWRQCSGGSLVSISFAGLYPDSVLQRVIFPWVYIIVVKQRHF